MNRLLSFLRLHVYVVVAYDGDRDKMRDCKVFWSQFLAMDDYRHKIALYGYANVLFASRRIL